MGKIFANEGTIHILLVEDEETHAELVRRAFEAHPRHACLKVVGSLQEAQTYLATPPNGRWPDLVITDLVLSDGQGIELLPPDAEAEAGAHRFPLVVMTSYGNEQVAVETMKAGVLDYVVKSPASLADMPRIAERALREWHHITERKRAEEEIQRRTAQLEALHQVGLELTAELDLKTLLHSIVSRAAQLVGCSSGGLYLHRPEQDVLEWTMAVSPHLAPVGSVLHKGEGLAGKVWETGKPLIVDDYQRWEGRASVHKGAAWKAVVAVPIYWGSAKAKKGFLGVLDIMAEAPRTFSLADAELLRLFATQAAIAIRNVQLYEAERKQRQLAEALEKAAAALSSTLDPDQVLDRILEQVKRVVPGDAFNIMLIEGDYVRVARRWGYEQLAAKSVPPNLTVPIDRFPSLPKMMQTGEPVVIPNTATASDWVVLEGQEWLHSYVAAPIRIADETAGFLNVNSATPDRFSSSDAHRLQAFASHAATAIENARLYSHLQKTNDQLRSALQAKDEMIQNVSHELRTPLGLIYSYIDLLKSKELGPLTAQQQRAIQVMHRQGSRLRFMVERLLVMQTFDASTLQRTRVDLRPWLPKIIQSWEMRATENRIRLHLEITPSISHSEHSSPLLVIVDSDLLSHVITNLLDNAFKFSPSGGLIQVRAWAEENQVIIAVSDEGVGIPPDKLERVFERFYQVNGSMTRRFGGMGIGLALCREIVQAHRGRIWAESKGSGQGSTFYVALPVENEQ